MSKTGYGNRKFYQIPDSNSSSGECMDETGKPSKKNHSRARMFRGSTRELVEMVDKNVIGRDTVFQGPFGPRRSLYMDTTASGEPLRCIEDFILDHVLPYYGNTHTTSTITSSQTTMFRQEAKDIVRNSVGASEHDVVIFCGFGCTGAVHKLVQAVMGDRTRPPPVVFVGPFEHHSSFIPWKDAGAKVVFIPETEVGTMDVAFLEDQLKEAVAEKVENRLLIGNFSVASNVTGCMSDDVAVTVLMHKYGGLAFWDYSAAAPHVQISMNPVVLDGNNEGLGKKDAMFFSGHKFIGGPQTPGVLVAKKSIFDNSVPNGGGGGSVFFVTKNSHRYLQNAEFREEGGTPAIVEAIRLGLAFRLKDTIGSHSIVSREAVFTKKVLAEWSKTPEIKVLGTKSEPRVGIISFLIEHPQSGYFLHHNFVVALLNDVFGIQSRGGCACAGPYGQSLLGIDPDLAKKYEDLLLEDSRLDRVHLRRDIYLEGSHYEIFRPGFVRVSVPFHKNSQDIQYLIEAVQLIAKHGYKLMPLYNCNPETGEFHHHANHIFHQRKWLSWGTFDANGIRYKERTRNNSEDYPNFRECLEQAKTIFNNASNLCKRRTLADQSLICDPSMAKLRWFLLPSEALTFVLAEKDSQETVSSIKSPKPFSPKVYKERESRDMTYYANSVPSQIMQSYWSDEIPSLVSLPHATIDLDSADILDGSSSLSSSDMQTSCDYEDAETEFLETAVTLGSYVTGPSICFSSGSAKTSYDTSSTNGKSDESDKKTMTMESQGTQTTGSEAAIPNISAAPEHHVVPSMTPLCSTQDFFNNGQFSDGQQFFSQQETVPQMNGGIPTSPNPCQPNIGLSSSCDFGNINNTGVNGTYGSPQANFQHQVNTLPNGGFYYEQQQPTQASPMPQYVPAAPVPQAPFVPTNCPSPCYQSYQPQNQSSLDSQYYCATDFSNTLSSPAMTPSPVPYQICMDSNHTGVPTMNPAYPQQQQYPTFQAPFSPGPTLSVPATPTRENFADSSLQEQLVEDAMRRATTEIANELKSEIRGVISQVERGIENGLRERSNSFTFKDRKIESLKRRARTLSGQSLDKYDDGKKLVSIAKTSSDKILGSRLSYELEKDLEKITGKTTRGDCHKCQIPDNTDKLGGGDDTCYPIIAGSKWHCPPKNIFKPTLNALREFSMIKDGDKVLVCLSGGKDSLSLLHCVKQAQHVLAKEGINFTFGAVTVDPKHPGFNPKPLIPYLKSLNVPYFFEEQGIMDTALEKGPETVTSICSFCSRMKRGRIYATARKNGYNVLAFGQHLDDLSESFLMSVFHNGLLRTMKASYTIKEEDLRVIRPFVYVREKCLREFAESRKLPVIPENCPACFDAPTERHRVKQLLAHQEIIFPKLFLSLRSAMKPLMAINRTGMESNATRPAVGACLANDDDD